MRTKNVLKFIFTYNYKLAGKSDGKLKRLSNIKGHLKHKKLLATYIIDVKY